MFVRPAEWDVGSVAIDIPHDQGVTWADYDNDGHLDLFVKHTGEVSNSLFRNNGSGEFGDVTLASGLTDIGESTGAAWGDYDNDGGRFLRRTV